jgi:DNA polymerase I-like protein with 3'-5' exonuclease and polymerase domains
MTDSNKPKILRGVDVLPPVSVIDYLDESDDLLEDSTKALREQVKVYYIVDPVKAQDAFDYIQSRVDEDPDLQVSLDFETTSLYPWDGEIRLTCICVPKSYVNKSAKDNRYQVFVIDHMYAKHVVYYYDLLATSCDFYNVFNVKFEGLWLDYVKEQANSGKNVILRDVDLLRKSVMGGGPTSLALLAKWDLNCTLDKRIRDSDWSATLLQGKQIYYGGFDAFVTTKLAERWVLDMEPQHWRGFNIMNDAWRATVFAELTGFKFDEDYHTKLINMWTKRQSVSYDTIRRIVPREYLPNINSKKQLSDFLKLVLDNDTIEAWDKTEKTGQLNTQRSELNKFSRRLPYPMSRFLAALMVYNRATKYLSTYGQKLLNAQRLSGRVYCGFNIARAITGRYSSSGAMNAQNYPNNPKVRASVVATNERRKLIVADYSSIELRILAEMSGDEQLKKDVIYGDMHAQSACALFRLNPEKFKEALEAKNPWAVATRRKSKAFSFQLTYGAAAPALSDVLNCSIDEAEEYIRRWAFLYPRAYRFRDLMFELMNRTGFLPCKSGRTIYVPKKDRSIPVASNYPIQGTGADVLYRAMTRMFSQIEKHNLDARIIAPVHDELLLEASVEDAEDTYMYLIDSMEAAWLDIFPDTSVHRLIEGAICDHWGEKS